MISGVRSSIDTYSRVAEDACLIMSYTRAIPQSSIASTAMVIEAASSLSTSCLSCLATGGTSHSSSSLQLSVVCCGTGLVCCSFVGIRSQRWFVKDGYCSTRPSKTSSIHQRPKTRSSSTSRTAGPSGHPQRCPGLTEGSQPTPFLYAFGAVGPRPITHSIDRSGLFALASGRNNQSMGCLALSRGRVSAQLPCERCALPFMARAVGSRRSAASDARRQA